MEKLVNETNAQTAAGVRAESKGDAGSSATAPHGAGVSEVSVDGNVSGRTGNGPFRTNDKHGAGRGVQELQNLLDAFVQVPACVVRVELAG